MARSSWKVISFRISPSLLSRFEALLVSPSGYLYRGARTTAIISALHDWCDKREKEEAARRR